MNFAKWIIAAYMTLAFIAGIGKAAGERDASTAVAITVGQTLVTGVLLFLLVAYA